MFVKRKVFAYPMLVLCVVFLIAAVREAGFIDVYLKEQNKTLKYKVKITDAENNILNDVNVEIERSKVTSGTLFAPKGKDETIKEVLHQNPAFFDFTGYISAYLTFSKKGYYPLSISANRTNARNATVKEITIILRKIPPLPKSELEFGEISLSYEKDGSSPAERQGWIYKKDEDGYIQESVVCKNVSDVDLYVARDKKENAKLYLVSNSDRLGFVIQPKAKDLTYLAMAPKEGYKRKVPLKYNLYDHDKNTFFVYWKIDGKCYGKMRLDATLVDRSMDEDYRKEDGVYVNYFLDIKYFINPSGSRNVATTYEDDY